MQDSCRLVLALTPATCSLPVGATLENMRRLDPKDHSGFALEEGILVATHVFPGEHVDVLRRSLIGTKLLDDGAADHNGPPGILRIDDRERDSWISVDIVRF